MANTTSAARATRVAKRRNAVNKSRSTRLKSTVRAVEEAIKSGDKVAAEAALKAAEPVLMRSSQKGVLHKRAASRKVSRLTARVRGLAASA
jgi:small subunit ribosomal protein S20